MERDEIRKLYDQAYASTYEDRFLHQELTRSDRDYEIKLIDALLKPEARWLDCACGTGYFLSQFPRIERMGVDLSPAMLERARAANPGVVFEELDLRAKNPALHDGWDLVTCMWYAYGLVDSLKEVLAVLDNLSDWTSPTGTLMLPVADPRLIARAAFPYKTDDTPWDGEVHIEGIIWSYGEDQGEKVHVHQIAPTPEFLFEALRRRFEKVEKVIYPPAMPGWEGMRMALLASEKKAVADEPTARFEPKFRE